MTRKKAKKSKKKPPREGCAIGAANANRTRTDARNAILHLRLIQSGGHIVELYRQCFPAEFRENGIDYTSAGSLLASYDKFTQLVDKYLFPVWPFSDLGGIYDEPAYCMETMSLCLYGGTYFYWERMQELAELPLVEKLIINAYGETEPFPEVDFVPPANWVFKWGLLQEACAREKGHLALLLLAAESVLGQTGNFWLDVTEEEYYQSEEPHWNETNISFFAAEWIEAKEMKKDVERFFSWVGHDPARVEKVKRLLRRAWGPKEEQLRVKAHSGKPLVEVLA